MEDPDNEWFVKVPGGWRPRDIPLDRDMVQNVGMSPRRLSPQRCSTMSGDLLVMSRTGRRIFEQDGPKLLAGLVRVRFPVCKRPKNSRRRRAKSPVEQAVGQSAEQVGATDVQEETPAAPTHGIANFYGALFSSMKAREPNVDMFAFQPRSSDFISVKKVTNWPDAIERQLGEGNTHQYLASYAFQLRISAQAAEMGKDTTFARADSSEEWERIGDIYHMRHVFTKWDNDVKAHTMDIGEFHLSLRLLGYPLHCDLLHAVLDDADMMRVGRLTTTDCYRLQVAYASELSRHAKHIYTVNCGEDSDEMEIRKFTTALAEVGCVADAVLMREMLRDCCKDRERTTISCAQFLGFVDKVMLKTKRFKAQELAGFSPPEVYVLEELFQRYRCKAGHDTMIRKSDVMNLLYDTCYMPCDADELATLESYVNLRDASHPGWYTFREFLWLLRIYLDCTALKCCIDERTAMVNCGLDRSALEEYKDIFHHSASVLPNGVTELSISRAKLILQIVHNDACVRPDQVAQFRKTVLEFSHLSSGPSVLPDGMQDAHTGPRSVLSFLEFLYFLSKMAQLNGWVMAGNSNATRRTRKMCTRKTYGSSLQLLWGSGGSQSKRVSDTERLTIVSKHPYGLYPANAVKLRAIKKCRRQKLKMSPGNKCAWPTLDDFKFAGTWPRARRGSQLSISKEPSIARRDTAQRTSDPQVHFARRCSSRANAYSTCSVTVRGIRTSNHSSTPRTMSNRTSARDHRVPSIPCKSLSTPVHTQRDLVPMRVWYTLQQDIAACVRSEVVRDVVGGPF